MGSHHGNIEATESATSLLVTHTFDNDRRISDRNVINFFLFIINKYI